MEEQKIEKTVKLKEGQIVVQADQLDAILKKLTELEKNVSTGQPVQIKPVMERKARVRMDGEFLIVGFKRRNWSKKDKDTGEVIDWCEIIMTDGEKVKTKEIPYLEFLRTAEIVDAKIIRQNITNKIESHGTVELKKVEDYKTVGQDVWLEAEVITPLVRMGMWLMKLP